MRSHARSFPASRDRARGCPSDRSDGSTRSRTRSPKRAEMMEAEQHRAVPAGRDADNRTASARPDCAESRVHEARYLDGDCGLPVATWAGVEVLGVRLAVARTLDCNDDRVSPERRHRPPQEVGVLVRDGRSGQAVEEVDNRVAPRRRPVAGRQIDAKPDLVVERIRPEAEIDGGRPVDCVHTCSRAPCGAGDAADHSGSEKDERDERRAEATAASHPSVGAP